jgi:recombination protein RecR
VQTPSSLINRLVEAFRCLPGVGPKTGQRMAFYLLSRARENGLNLAKVLEQAMQKVGHCRQCRTFCEEEICQFCLATHRDPHLICVVETPADVVAVEQSGIYRGRYFVLMGHLSPLDGIGPQDLGIKQLMQRLEEEPIREMVIATNPTVEGEATAHYLADLIKSRNIKVTRIAHGVPLGGELDSIDENTLARAFTGRVILSHESV